MHSTPLTLTLTPLEMFTGSSSAADDEQQQQQITPQLLVMACYQRSPLSSVWLENPYATWHGTQRASVPVRVLKSWITSHTLMENTMQRVGCWTFY